VRCACGRVRCRWQSFVVGCMVLDRALARPLIDGDISCMGLIVYTEPRRDCMGLIAGRVAPD
jgi:hypothetical protein